MVRRTALLVTACFGISLVAVLPPTHSAGARDAECRGARCEVTGTHARPGATSAPSSPTPRPRRSSTSTSVPCTRDGGTLSSEVLRSDGDDFPARMARHAGYPIPHAPPPGDQWVFRICSASPGGAFYLDGPPTLAAAGVTDARPFQWAALSRAVAIVALHQPQLTTSPPLDAHVVAIPTWLATTPATTTVLTESVTDGPVTVTITATPTHLTFDPGDGSAPITCTPAPTSPTGACRHTYPVNGTFGTTAHLHYAVDWTSTIGGAGTIVDGAVTTTPTDLTVREIQSLIR